MHTVFTLPVEFGNWAFSRPFTFYSVPENLAYLNIASAASATVTYLKGFDKPGTGNLGLKK